ncbi:MAG: ribonuclease Z [Bacteroidota bacterium]|nr:ribonuclease Z [Bacteroidota bacterium]
MQKASLTILGCGSAMPTRKNFPSSQLLEIRDKQFLIDCGEGAQIRMGQLGVKVNRLGHIFISHLHGDHCFGLIGLISTFGMLNRTAELHIHAQPDLEKLLRPQLLYFCTDLSFSVIFHSINPRKNELIYEDRSIQVFSIPLKHRVPCCGFLFEEKPRDRHIIREMIDFYHIPTWRIPKIKQGEDFETEEGEIIPNTLLTRPSELPKRFAYCSDTAYSEKIIPIIEGVDCLYHEATFMEDELVRSKNTEHSTARQAGLIARKAHVKKLIIGHYSARYNNQLELLNEAKAEFENTVLGEDLTVYEI